MSRDLLVSVKNPNRRQKQQLKRLKEEDNKRFNANLMRALINQKMVKHKSFFETKVMKFMSADTDRNGITMNQVGCSNSRPF